MGTDVVETSQVTNYQEASSYLTKQNCSPVTSLFVLLHHLIPQWKQV